jgi:hypothetical protein
MTNPNARKMNVEVYLGRLAELVIDEGPRLGALLRAEENIEKEPIPFLMSPGQVLKEIAEAGRWLEWGPVSFINTLGQTLNRHRAEYEEKLLWLTDPAVAEGKQEEEMDRKYGEIHRDKERREQREQGRIEAKRKNEERAQIEGTRHWLTDIRARHQQLTPELEQKLRKVEEIVARYDADNSE